RAAILIIQIQLKQEFRKSECIYLMRFVILTHREITAISQYHTYSIATSGDYFSHIKTVTQDCFPVICRSRRQHLITDALSVDMQFIQAESYDINKCFF